MIRGFFLPKLLGLNGQEVHRDPTTQPMANQTLIRSHLERAETRFLLGSFKPHLHVPASERRPQHVVHLRLFRGIADEVVVPEKVQDIPLNRTVEMTCPQ